MAHATAPRRGKPMMRTITPIHVSFKRAGNRGSKISTYSGMKPVRQGPNRYTRLDIDWCLEKEKLQASNYDRKITSYGENKTEKVDKIANTYFNNR